MLPQTSQPEPPPNSPARRRIVEDARYFASVAIAMLLVACGQRTDVEFVHPRVDTMRESFIEPARTHLDVIHEIRVPVDGRIGRVELDPGDPVEQGAELVPFDRVPLEERLVRARGRVKELEAEMTLKRDNRLEETVQTQAETMVQATDETVKAFDESIRAMEVQHERVKKERARVEQLAADGTVSQSDLDDVQVEEETLNIDLRRQSFYREALRALAVASRLGPQFTRQYVERKSLEFQVIEQQLVQARADLAHAEHQLALATIASPVDGIVLERLDRGDRAASAGEPLLRVGSLDQLEIAAEVLTNDALRLHPGSVVELSTSLSPTPILGRVDRVDPSGFTKLSSLGVEQQRVRVYVTPDSRPAALGVNYRVRARFITATAEGVLVVPRYSVLEASDGTPYVLVESGNKIARQKITVGLRSDLEVEVTSGLTEASQVVRYPEAGMEES